MKTPSVLFFLSGVILSLIPLAAQEVAVGEPVWALASAAPDEVPRFKERLRPSFPAEMKNSAELGYVIVAYAVDAQGDVLMRQAYGSHVPFLRAVETEMVSRKMIAGKRGDQRVDGTAWMPVIFNPKSAAAKNADATPRLLAVFPVVMSPKAEAHGAPRMVRLQLALDATGAIVRTDPPENLSPEVLTSIREALQHWRFAPARSAGQPVATELAVSVVCQPAPPPQEKIQTPPKVVKRELPRYPASMRQNGMRGEVVVDFTVDQKGEVKDPKVVRSNNAAFDEPALASVRQWKFQPGLTGGRPTSTHMQVPIFFQLDLPGGGKDAYQVENRSQEKLPPELRHDTPAKIRGTVVPVYPRELLSNGVRGRASAMMQIASDGRVVGVKVLSADRPEFGLALTAALENFTFDPALKNGMPVTSFLNYEQEFNANALPDKEADRLLTLEKKHPEKIMGANKLDAIPQAISRRLAIFPVQLEEGVTSGDAMIEFLIDTDGHVRLPRIMSASQPAFGYAAVQAVNSWIFSPPLVGGKPAVARAQVPLKFKVAEREAKSDVRPDLAR